MKQRRVAEIVMVVLLACVMVSLAAGEGEAEDGGSSVAVGVKVGTTGVGADLTLRVTDTLNIRANVSTLQLDHDDTVDDVEYDIDVDFEFLGVLLDVHPFDNGFRLTAGAVWNNSDLTLNAVLAEPESIGNGIYSPESIGTLTGVLTFDDFAPYIGIGFGNAVGTDGRWTFSFDLGIIVQQYEVDLTADGPISTDAGFLADLEQEETDIQEELDGIEIYPVLSFGVACAF